MSNISSKVRDFLKNLLNSLPEIIFGFILFLLAISGVIIALILRSLGFNGANIVFLSLITEIFCLIAGYFIFNRRYIKEEPEKEKIKKFKK
ncbi:MAG: hypothetical protein ACQERB_12165 [Promethearchaeati archaeon]